MITNNQQLVSVIDFWQNVAREDVSRGRELADAMDQRTKEIVDIVGVRRSGKSAVLKLLMKELGRGDDLLYINFEDPFFIENNQATIIDEIISTYQEYFGQNLKRLFFDEIQVVEQWEKAIRKLRESGKYKIYLTGSSSKLLSGELSSLLTGRHLSYKLMPLSFAEYLDFTDSEIKSKKDVIVKSKNLLKKFDDYLSIGGFPEVVLTRSEELLKQYFFDIIQKDIVMRHSLRDAATLEKMAIFLISNSAKVNSIESIKKAFNISYKTASTYIEYFKESFLIFELPQFSFSVKKQQRAIKKYYAVDCGLANAAAIRFSEDKGRMLENCVYLHLQRGKREIYYYKTKNNLEADFLLKESIKTMTLIQVAWSIKDPKTREREIKALTTAMNELGSKKGLILTHDEEDKMVVDGKTIVVEPVYKWMLKKEEV